MNGRDNISQNSYGLKENTDKKCYNNTKVLNVSEYRKILGDYKSTDEQIENRLRYLEAFCKNIIKIEIEKYAKKSIQA